MNKSCEEKLWTKAVNKSFEQVNKSCKQKLWMKGVNKSSEQKVLNKVCTRVVPINYG